MDAPVASPLGSPPPAVAQGLVRTQGCVGVSCTGWALVCAGDDGEGTPRCSQHHPHQGAQGGVSSPWPVLAITLVSSVCGRWCHISHGGWHRVIVVPALPYVRKAQGALWGGQPNGRAGSL